MLRQESYARTREDHEASDGRRNPYLADCGERRSHHQGQGASRRERVSGSRTGQNSAGRPGLERYTRPVSARGGSTGSRISAGSTGGGRRVSRAGRPEEARLFLYEEDGLSLLEKDGLPKPYQTFCTMINSNRSKISWSLARLFICPWAAMDC